MINRCLHCKRVIYFHPEKGFVHKDNDERIWIDSLDTDEVWHEAEPNPISIEKATWGRDTP